MKRSIKLHLMIMAIMVSAMWCCIIGGTDWFRKWEVFESHATVHVESTEEWISVEGEVVTHYITYYNEDGSVRETIEMPID